MSSDESPLPVIIRYEGKGRADRPDWRLSDIVAVFPTEPGEGARDMACYSSVGQHSTCAAGYIGRNAGYANLRIVSRASAEHARARRTQLKERK